MLHDLRHFDKNIMELQDAQNSESETQRDTFSEYTALTEKPV